MGRASLAILVLVAAVAVTAADVRAMGAAARPEPWPVGVTVAPEPPIPERNAPALAALGNRRLFVFGGGELGEGVSEPDGHNDGAILDLRTRTWTRIRRAPFKVVYPAAVWTGDDVIVVGGEPRCASNIDDIECRSTRTRVGIYSPATDSWRELDIPSGLGRSITQAPLTWTGRDALFFTGSQIFTVRANGRVVLVDTPDAASVGGSVCVAGDHVAVADRPRNPEMPHGPLHILDPKTLTWTTTSPPPPGPASLGFPVCTTGALLLPSRDLTQILAYDLADNTWSELPLPQLPGYVPCSAATYPSCTSQRWTAQDDRPIVWSPDLEPARQYNPTRGAWTSVAAGPDTQPGDAPGRIAWTNTLAATYATAGGPGNGPGRQLLVYRPR